MVPLQPIAHSLATVCGLALLEAVLSADNALALSTLVRHVEPAHRRIEALNWGLLLAFCLRALMILMASRILRFPLVQVLGGSYLLWLACRHFQAQWQGELEGVQAPVKASASMLQLVGLLGVTDLAFSLDSVTAAIGLTQQLPLVILGGGLGVLFLRFSAGLFLQWLDHFVHLENAAYLSVLAVGLRLVGQVVMPALAPTETATALMMVAFFAWGFSQRQPSAPEPDWLTE